MTRSSSEEEGEAEKEARALGRRAPGADSWQLSADSRSHRSHFSSSTASGACLLSRRWGSDVK